MLPPTLSAVNGIYPCVASQTHIFFKQDFVLLTSLFLWMLCLKRWVAFASSFSSYCRNVLHGSANTLFYSCLKELIIPLDTNRKVSTYEENVYNSNFRTCFGCNYMYENCNTMLMLRTYLQNYWNKCAVRMEKIWCRCLDHDQYWLLTKVKRHFSTIKQIPFWKLVLYASNVSFYSCRVTNTVVKPRKCIDIVLRVNKVIKAVEMWGVFWWRIYIPHSQWNCFPHGISPYQEYISK